MNAVAKNRNEYNSYDFTDSMFEEIIEYGKKALHLSVQEVEKINRCIPVKLILNTIWLSGMGNTEIDRKREAISKLATFVVASRVKELSSHTIDDSLYSRIDPLLHFSSGNPEIIKGTKILLALWMIEDQFCDIYIDNENNKFNPISIGQFKYKEVKNHLLTEYSLIDYTYRQKLNKFKPDYTIKMEWF